MNRPVIVTGASTGIGEACALHLDSLGFTVYAGVRKEEDAERLRASGSNRLKPIHLDVTEPEDIAAAAKLIDAEWNGRLFGLVNNAGIAIAGPLELLPLEDIRRQFEVNVTGQIAVIQALVPALRKGRGRIVNIGSISGRMSGPYSSPYSASKFALEAITDSLRVELLPWGIHVAIVEPGNIKTPIWQKSIKQGEDLLARMPQDRKEALDNLYPREVEAMFKWASDADRSGIAPSKVAEAVWHALVSPRPKTRYLVGADARIQAFLARFVPDRVRDRLVFRMLGTPRKK